VLKQQKREINVDDVLLRKKHEERSFSHLKKMKRWCGAQRTSDEKGATFEAGQRI
jgi:hypothetical protein